MSKRKLLSLVSSVSDPLGLLSPATNKGKVLIREAWRLKLGSDETLPPFLLNVWSDLAEELKGKICKESPKMAA